MLESRIILLHELSRAAGVCLKGFFGSDLEIHKKGELDLVTEADTASERLIVNGIAARFPKDAILAEEGGRQEGSSPFRWIIDPLDGTTNFAHHFPHFSVSIGLEREGELVAGVVFDPMKDEFFEARQNGGARMNGLPLRTANCVNLADTLIVTGFPYDRRQRMTGLLDRVERILTQARGIRRLGSAALDLAYVAAGRFDAFVEDGLNSWDIAAGALLVREAGGRITGFDGAPLDLDKGQVVAANPALIPAILAKIVAD